MTVHEYPRSHGSLSGLSDTDHHVQYSLDLQDVFANRPLPGRRGRLFFATDLGVYYRDTGTTWTSFGIGSPLTIRSVAVTDNVLTLQGISGQTAHPFRVARTAADGSVTYPMVVTAEGHINIDRYAPGQTDASIRARRAGNAFEFGHGNGAGYGSVIGAEAGSGAPTIVFSGEHGATSNTYTTRGFRPFIMRYASGAAQMQFQSVPNANAADQTASTFLDMDLLGNTRLLGGALAVGGTGADVGFLPAAGALHVRTRSAGDHGVQVRLQPGATAFPYVAQNSDGATIVSFEPRVGGSEGTHLRLTNPKPATNDTYGKNVSPFFILESRTWDSAAGNVAQYGGMYLGHESFNNTAPTSALVFTGSRDAALVDMGYWGPDNGLVVYSAKTIRTAGQMLARYITWDFRGDGVTNVYSQDYPTDANQLSFTTAPEGETYRTLRAGGFVTASKAETKVDVQPLDVTAGAVSQGQQVRLLKATTTRPLRDRVRALSPVSYHRKWADGEGDDPKTHAEPTLYSFVAEEAARVVPEIVAFDVKGEASGIDIGAMGVVTLALVQDLMARIDNLEAALNN